MPEAEYSHILSFRRLVFIAPPTEAIPDSLTITSDGTTYRIFLSTDSLKCTQCNKLGHTQLQCPESAENTTNHHTEPNTRSTTSNLTDSVTVTQSTDPILPSQQKVTDLPAPPNKQQTKRQLSISPDAEQDKPTFFLPSTTQPTKKKATGGTQHHLESAKEFIELQYPKTNLNLTEVADLIDNSHSSKDIVATMKNYSNNLPELLTFLIQLHSKINDRSIKLKITKIRKKLCKKLELETSEESDCSQTSQPSIHT
nr:unnamed protein product [Callosobruchus analis]